MWWTNSTESPIDAGTDLGITEIFSKLNNVCMYVFFVTRRTKQ